MQTFFSYIAKNTHNGPHRLRLLIPLVGVYGKRDKNKENKKENSLTLNRWNKLLHGSHDFHSKKL